MKSKAALRRERLKQETDAINEKLQRVRAANELEDALSDLPLFRHFDKGGLTFDLLFHRALPAELRDWVFGLTEGNMRAMYEQTWGWNERTKRQELFGDDARYLVAVAPDGRPLAFANVNFAYQDGRARAYLMEFQVEPSVQRRGVGRFILQAVEFVALKRGMEEVALTVFRINTGAMSFYKKMHYVYHEYSPCVANPADTSLDYEVLCKSLVKKQK